MQYRINIGFKNMEVNETNIRLKRGDFGSHTFVFNILDKIKIDGCEFGIAFINKNKEIGKYTNLRIENNQLMYDLDDFILENQGVISGEVIRYKNGKKTTSCTFTFDVLEDIDIN